MSVKQHRQRRIVRVGLLLLLIRALAMPGGAPVVAAEENLTPGAPIRLTATEAEWLQQHGKIRVANEDDWPPFDFSANGEARGISMDYIRLIARRVGLSLEFINGYTWAELQEMAKTKKLDILTSIVKTPAREKRFLFTDPYLESPSVIATLNTNHSIARIEDLFGKSVAVIKGYYIEEQLRTKFPEIRRVQVANVLAGLKSVSYGTQDAFIGSLAVINYELNRVMLTNLKIVGESGVRDIDATNLSLAVHRDHEVLQGILQKGIEALTQAEKLAIQSRWAAVVQKPVPGEQTEAGTLSSQAGQSVGLTAEEKTFLKQHPIIRVHNETDWPPFNFHEDNRPQGLSIDYMNLVASKLGIMVDYVSGPSWNDFLGMIKDKTLDVMLNIVKTEDRQKYILYTEPYALNPNVIVSLKNNKYDRIEVLADKTVAFPKGFFYEEVFTKNYPRIKRLPVGNTLESLKAVSIGKADAAVGENAVFHHLIGKHLLTDLAVSGEVEIGDPDIVNLRIGIRDDWPLFRDIMLKGMKSVTLEEMNQLRRKWIAGAETSHQKVLSLTGAEKRWLQKHPLIRVAADPKWAPMEFIGRDGEFKGVSRDFLDRISALLGVKFLQVKGLTWAEGVAGVKNREIDMFGLAMQTPSRTKFVDFTDPYIELPQMIFTRDDYPYVAGLGDLAGNAVAVVRGYATIEFLRRDHPEIDILDVRDVEEALQALVSGRAVAYIDALLTTTYNIQKMGYANIKVSGEVPYKFELCMAPRNDWPMLGQILQKALVSINEQDRNAMFRKWQSIEYQHKFDYAILWRVLGAVAVVLGLFLFWNRRLAREVADRKRAEAEVRRERDRAQKYLDIVGVIIVVIDRSRKVALINRKGSEILGYPEDKVTGRDWFELAVPADDRPRAKQVFNRLMQGELRSAPYFEHAVSTRSGERRTIAWYNTVLQNENGKVLFTLSSGEDITERKVAEQQLQQAKETAEAATKAKSDFLAKMSHELRTPLNAIIGYSEMLMEDARDLGQEGFSSDLDRIHTSGMHLLGLINDVLDLSKIEAGKIELYLETFAVADMIAEVAGTIGPLVAQNANTLNVSCADTVGTMRADLTKVRQTLLNLIGNACKFTEQGTISLTVSRKSVAGNDWIIFLISDTGIGMSAAQMEKMYQAFTQAEASTASRYGGTGLGLAISKQFCRMMGGEIDVESQVGKGTTFTISIPAEGAAAERIEIVTPERIEQLDTGQITEPA